MWGSFVPSKEGSTLDELALFILRGRMHVKIQDQRTRGLCLPQGPETSNGNSKNNWKEKKVDLLGLPKIHRALRDQGSEFAWVPLGTVSSVTC